MPKIHKELNINLNETIAIIGAGGKTTMLWLLANERKNKIAFVTTTTHILKPKISQCDKIISAYNHQNFKIEQNKITALLFKTENEKYTGATSEQFKQIQKNNIPILYEADGSKNLPAKIHNQTEPVIYNKTDKIILILGLSALGQKVNSVCHRYELNKNLQPNELFTLKQLKICIDDGIKSCKFPPEKIRIFLNQLDLIKDKKQIENFCKNSNYKFIKCGSLKNMGCTI